MNYKGNDKYGSLPRRTVIANQPHMLAYINPQEEMLLRQLGGTGQDGPMGVPAYPPMGDYAYDGGAGTFSGGNGGGGGGVSANDYNAAIGRVNQTIGRDYNQGARNRDLATIDSYNASFTPVNDPSEIATATTSAPVSIDSGMGAAIAANDGVSDTSFTGTAGASANVTGTDFDFGAGSTDGVGSSAGDTYAVSDAGEYTVDPTDTSGSTTTSIVGTSMFDNMRALRGLPPLGEIEVTADDTVSDLGRADVDQDAGMGAAISDNDGVSEIGSSGYDIGPSGYVSLDAIADNSGVSDIGPSGYVSLDAIADNSGVSDVGIADADFGMGSIDGVSDEGIGNIGSGGVDFDSGGDYLGEFGGSGVDLGGNVSAGAPENDFDFGAGSTDGVGTSAGEGGDISIDPYAIDIQDTNIYTENDDGTFTVTDGEPDPIEMGGDGEGEPPANGGDGNGGEPPVNEPEPEIDPAEYFNLFRSTAPSGWLRDSIWSSVGTGPDFDVDVYQEADGSLRFRETGELVPEEYMKYIDLARRTEMDAPGEEEEVA